MSTTSLEKENLEAHVELCAVRYKQLEYRLDVIEIKVEQISKDILVGQKSMSKVIIGSTGTIVAALLSTIATILIAL